MGFVFCGTRRGHWVAARGGGRLVQLFAHFGVSEAGVVAGGVDEERPGVCLDQLVCGQPLGGYLFGEQRVCAVFFLGAVCILPRAAEALAGGGGGDALFDHGGGDGLCPAGGSDRLGDVGAGGVRAGEVVALFVVDDFGGQFSQNGGGIDAFGGLFHTPAPFSLVGAGGGSLDGVAAVLFPAPGLGEPLLRKLCTGGLRLFGGDHPHSDERVAGAGIFGMASSFCAEYFRALVLDGDECVCAGFRGAVIPVHLLYGGGSDCLVLDSAADSCLVALSRRDGRRIAARAHDLCVGCDSL